MLPAWSLPVLLGIFLTSNIGLLRWIVKKFDTRLERVELALGDLKVIAERGERHETEINSLHERLTDLTIKLIGGK